MLDIALSDHQGIYCTRKCLKQKFRKHKYIQIRSTRNYSLWIEKLRSLEYPDYSGFDDVDIAYSHFMDRTSVAINEIAPFKSMCVKGSTREWVDEEVLEAINTRNKVFQKFKQSKSYDDNARYKKSRNDVQNIIKRKKKDFISNKLTENIGKPKVLWKTLKKIGASTKEQSMSTICLKKDGKIEFDTKTICGIFKDFFVSLATNLS